MNRAEAIAHIVATRAFKKEPLSDTAPVFSQQQGVRFVIGSDFREDVVTLNYDELVAWFIEALETSLE